MELNREKFEQLFCEKFNASYAEASRQLGVSTAQIFRILNNKGNAGAKFLGKLITYCDTHNLNFREYIFLPNPLTKVKEIQLNLNQQYGKKSNYTEKVKISIIKKQF